MFAFTLAEVLITIGIIGVVAALTIPNLVTSYQKKVTANKVFSFYSKINQAARLSSAYNADLGELVELEKDYTKEDIDDFFTLYLQPYIKVIKKENCNPTNPKTLCVNLADGTFFTFYIDSYGGSLHYFVNGKRENSPRNDFTFQFGKRGATGSDIVRSKNFIEPYIFEWTNNDINALYNPSKFGCNKNSNTISPYVYCAKILQLSNWKFPDNYPW